MICQGNFVFKSIEKRDKGEFTNKETGELVSYGSCFILKADEVGEKINERKFRINENNDVFVSKLKTLKAYTPVELVFDVFFYNDNARVVAKDVIVKED